MYVKFIVLEGFKSYRDRTRIGPFDPHFNAITGLNGSGKSNILDGICFVLGISSMGVVRCKTLADCIYTGQGESLNRGTVSIILDNSDKAKSPPGQETYDEIVVSRVVHKTGDCRYYINKTSAMKRAVTDLFESVQLNVNNPNFMIMQGKITKVVNMKPKELLHMIEETVGATLYQSKREKAVAELRNKNQVVESINSLLAENVKPTLEKQIRATELIQEYNILIREKQFKARDYAIVRYFEVQQHGRVAEQKLNSILEKDKKDDEVAEQHKQEIKELKQREEQMKKENTAKFKEQVETTEKAMQAEKKKLHAKETDVKTAREALQEARKAVKDAEKTKTTEEKQVSEFKSKSAKSLGEFEELQQEKNNATEELQKAREQETQLRSGKILDDQGKSMDVDQELNRLGTEISSLKPDVDDGRQKIAEYKGKVGPLEQQLKQTPSDDHVEREYKEKLKAFEDIKREANRRNINAEESVIDIRNELSASTKQQDALVRERNAITNRNYHLSLVYDQNRVPNGVHGCIYDLIKINGIDEWGNAMEAALGGLMTQIVVDTDVTGKALVNPKIGNLRRRALVHPLNVFRSTYRPSRVTQQELDRKFGPGNALFALDLIQCDRTYRPIVEHYMGNKVMCKDMAIARKIAFELGLKAFTVEGDTVDPGGIMRGGSTANVGEQIRLVVKLYEINHQLQQLDVVISQLNQKLEVAKGNEKFIEQLEKVKRELHNADQMRKVTKYSQLKQEIDSTKAKIQEESVKLQEIEARYKALEKERAQLQKKADQVETLREKNIRDNANLIKKWEKALEAVTKKYEARQKYFNDIEMDLRSKEDYLNGCQKDIDDAIAFVKECEEKLAKTQEGLRVFAEHFETFQQAHAQAVAESNEWFEEAKTIQDRIKALDAKKEASEINKMKRNNDRKQYQDTVDHATHEIENIREMYSEIDFGTVNKPADIRSANGLKRDLETISKKVEDMQQRLDHEAAAALGTTKRDYTASHDKVVQIEKNKTQLKKAIETLDDAKKKKVEGAYADVNQKFNDMMQTLLPEARARLVEVTPGDLSQGVNIHVQLGGVWKESLTELSGGQRSLVALSLVLSLCMYNPAPFYILDEVDAALDLSHTQNIGVVIQRQFKGTQFICVSLKDGMFSNANVLFSAKHEGGRSVVQRSQKAGLTSMPPPNTESSSRKKAKYR